MKKEIIKILVSYAIKYDTPESREEAINTVIKEHVYKEMCGGLHNYNIEQIGRKLQ